MALAAVDLEYLRKVRREILVFTHRRQDVYQLPTCVSPNILPLPPDETTFPFGQVNIKGWAIGQCFTRVDMHSLAFVNRNASFLDVRSRCDSNAIFVPSFNFLKIHFGIFSDLLVMLLKPTRRIPDMQPDELADLFLTAQRVQRGMELFPLRFFVERCRLRRSRCRAKHSS